MLGKPLILQFSGADAPIKPGVITTSSDFVPYFYQIFGWFASLHLLSYQEFTDTTKNIEADRLWEQEENLQPKSSHKLVLDNNTEQHY